jgi:hypothetical protein
MIKKHITRNTMRGRRGRGRMVVGFMTIYAISAISVILWRALLLLKDTRVPGENHRLSPVNDKIYCIMLYRVHFPMSGIRTHNILANLSIFN